MDKKETLIKTLNLISIILMLIITICGIFSFNLSNSHQILNQYGDTVRMYGSGIYAHDSYFKGLLSIGTDITMLIIIVPMLIVSLKKRSNNKCTESYIANLTILSVVLYYSVSIAFGIVYNRLHLMYIALFGVSLYAVIIIFYKLLVLSIRNTAPCKYSINKGIIVFLIITGIALFAAWLPDIITSLVNNTSLELIEVYTTEITYVLDMGIISPLMFVILYLVKKNYFIGYVLLRSVLKLCIVIGIMIPIQSIFHLIGEIQIPIAAIISKGLVFIILAVLAAILEHKLIKTTQYYDEKLAVFGNEIESGAEPPI